MLNKYSTEPVKSKGNEDIGPHILLVEDNIVNQMTMVTILKKFRASFVIHRAKNYEQAIELFQAHKAQIQLIICDGNIDSFEKPQGPEVVETILNIQEEENLDIPIMTWTDDPNRLGQAEPNKHGESSSSVLPASQAEALKEKSKKLTFIQVFSKHEKKYYKLDKPLNKGQLKDRLNKLDLINPKAQQEELMDVSRKHTM
jgi:CheY-like chemotaxis protein